MSQLSDPVRVGELVGAFLAERGMRERLGRYEVIERWPELVGEKIAEVTTATAISGSTLFVEVRSSAWLTELTMMKSEILARVNHGRDPGAKIEKLMFVQGG